MVYDSLHYVVILFSGHGRRNNTLSYGMHYGLYFLSQFIDGYNDYISIKVCCSFFFKLCKHY